jgi:hypothetical protein
MALTETTTVFVKFHPDEPDPKPGQEMDVQGLAHWHVKILSVGKTEPMDDGCRLVTLRVTRTLIEEKE